jgi:hypothetical protein
MRQSRWPRVPTAEHREPCESRGSRTVLGARGGEIPPRDSPFAPFPALRMSALAPTCDMPRGARMGWTGRALGPNGYRSP